MTTIYHADFKYPSRVTGKWDAGNTVDWPVLHCMAEVAKLILDQTSDEHPVMFDIDRIRVIRMDIDEGRCADVTRDALMSIGLAAFEADGEWPAWLNDIRPDGLPEVMGSAEMQRAYGTY